MVVEVEVEKELDRVEAQESTENEIPVAVCEVVNDVNKRSYENGNLDMRSSNLTVEDRNLEAHQEVEGNGDETDRDDDDHSQHYDEEITEGSKVKDEMSHDHDDTSMSSKLDHGTADTDEEIPRAESQNSCDPEILRQQELIERSSRVTELEHALYDSLLRKDAQIERLSNEVIKLKAFISKRKQTYKRKRKDEGAPTRALSAYNIFVQDRFSKLAKENEQALNSADLDAQMRRVPPASLVASTGNQWKELTPEEKNEYEERYVAPALNL
jgi:HMG-box domain